MKYVEVAVDAPIGYNRTLSYGVPSHIELEPGQLVWVPLSTRPVQGIVFETTGQPQVDVIKDVAAPIEPSPLLSLLCLELAHWMSGYYMSTLFDAAALMLPPGFKSRLVPYLRLGNRDREDEAELNPAELETLDYVTSRRRMNEKHLLRAVGKSREREIRRLLRKDILTRQWELSRPKVSYRYDCFIRPATAASPRNGLLNNVSPKQKALYAELTASREPVALSVANKQHGASSVKGLLAKGLVALDWVRLEREPALLRKSQLSPETVLRLTSEQERALAQIVSALEGNSNMAGPFLLHGVTGSGKTEVYLRALEHCVRMGRKGIFLVPEIALTPQTVHRLNSRFPGRVAVLHSGLSLGEQFEQWWRISDGEYDVVVGPRSALFAPVPDLGLVVIDEEHEWTYKQQDASPRYHTREVALKLTQLAGAVLVMGSATPDVETYHRAKRGDHVLQTLSRRITPAPRTRDDGANLASVQVSDMRKELKEGNRSIFSRALDAALRQCIDGGEQAILFINRRGASTVVQCRDCGHTLSCRSCAVTLTYHTIGSRLVCHQCNRRSSLPKGCPQCRSPRIRYLGLGTQRVMEELKKTLPNITALRWDRDTARPPLAHEQIMERFVQGDAQVLVGTQMVAKGLHLPGVSLVGVLLADIGMNLPDFRAGERVFQLLCQVAGRAGRGVTPGRVIVQTYSPDHYAVKAAARQDYGLLYDKEIAFRRQHGNPPFNQLVHMSYLHTNEAACQREAQRMGKMLRQTAYGAGITDVDVVGPAPGFPERVRGRYRWHLILRGRNLQGFLENTVTPQGWVIDVDPVTVL